MHPHDPLTEHFRLLPPQRSALKRLGITTVIDLLYHFPVRYGDTASVKAVRDARAGEQVTFFGRITGLKTSKGFRTKIPMASGTLEDESGTIKCVWFNQPYLAKMIADEALVRVEGRVSERRKTQEVYLSNPKIEVVQKVPIGVGDSLFKSADGGPEVHVLHPVYPESRGITSNWMYHAVQKIFASGILETMGAADPLPPRILKEYSLPPLATALVWIHAPQKEPDAVVARKRFAFEEIFFIQLERQKARREYQQHPTFTIRHTAEHMKQFTDRLPFALTSAQQHAVDAILEDFARGHAMSRLLEGDVGSGKTAVAAATAYAIVTSAPKENKFGRLQVAYMAPTEILATQHFESFIGYFKHLPGMQVGLITGSGCRKFPSKIAAGRGQEGWTDISRAQLLRWVERGEISVLIGTHALIQKSVKFKNLAYAIVDEQHRFGTSQRGKLVRKDRIAPHLLSMTATPIPRTLALTMYGDLDLTVVDQMPLGRKPVITEIVLAQPSARKAVYEKIRTELTAGRQAYIICPRINEPDPDKEQAVAAKSVTEEAKRLKQSIFPEYRIGILHSKMKPDEKDRVMMAFKNHQVDILVATSVVEVGVNVPNATVIIIEGGERFGLSQLHQLRGRVIRSNHQAYCFVFAETKSDKTVERLRALKTAKNGFELAEFDLKFRGAGDLSGIKQWGVTDIAMDALQNIKLVEAARTEALRILDTDLTLSAPQHAPLRAEMAARAGRIVHLE